MLSRVRRVDAIDSILPGAAYSRRCSLKTAPVDPGEAQSQHFERHFLEEVDESMRVALGGSDLVVGCGVQAQGRFPRSSRR